MVGPRLIERVLPMNKAYVGFTHYNLLSGNLFSGSIISAVSGQVSKVASSFRLLGGKGILTDLVTNAGVLHRQTLGGPENPNFALKVGPGGTPGFYGIVTPIVTSTRVSPNFAATVG